MPYPFRVINTGRQTLRHDYAPGVIWNILRGILTLRQGRATYLRRRECWRCDECSSIITPDVQALGDHMLRHHGKHAFIIHEEAED